MTLAPHDILTSKGEAVGKINGFSHMVLVCRDMDATVRFYRDILGLKLIATSGEAAIKARDAEDAKDSKLAGEGKKRPFTRQYFFQLPNGEGFGFYEVPDAVDGRETTPLGYWYWPGAEDMPPAKPHKLDHLAFNVPTKEDVKFFMNRLTENGIKFIGPFDARPGGWGHYVHRIYFFDPSGNALEIATIGDPGTDSSNYVDTDPVPALLER